MPEKFLRPQLLFGLFAAAVVGAFTGFAANQMAGFGLGAAAGALGGGVAVLLSVWGYSPSKGASSSVSPSLIRAVADGKLPRRPSDLSTTDAEVWDALEAASEALDDAETERDELQEEGTRAGRELEALRREVGEARTVRERLELEVKAAEANREKADLEMKASETKARELDERIHRAEAEARNREEELRRLRRIIDDASGTLQNHVEALSSGARRADGRRRADHQLHEGDDHLARRDRPARGDAGQQRRESSSSILEMTATNDEVAENMANLASSVRETVSSIEEMAYSIKEVARNVDALSLTAEETSSSMNEMDVSIDQVQSNANETARLSEEVAIDAEKGAESIIKIITEINRIKETSSEAVSVISNLGSRIEAIGDILNVIDDVAEQTNLLALNAAIIAAQAGEHGKGFAVVADEIKDLAERAGASTKEIAELIKTIQQESKNAIVAVERGANTVDRGVTVSAEAERALKKILESARRRAPPWCAPSPAPRWSRPRAASRSPTPSGASPRRCSRSRPPRPSRPAGPS
jgi:methyl-accepting chemotaxis protein